MAIATLGVSLALIIALHALAEGFARLGLFSLALGIIPVLAISQIKNWRYGLILGTFFGVVSLLTAVIKGYAGVSVWHNVINPLVSVLPRAVVGVSCSLLSVLAYKIMDKVRERNARKENVEEDTGNETIIAESNEQTELNDENTGNAFEPNRISARKVGKWTVEYLIHAVITLVGVLLNAVGFLGMLLAFAYGETVPTGNGATFNLLYVLEFVVGTNTLIEAIVFTFLVPAIIQALKRAKVFR